MKRITPYLLFFALLTSVVCYAQQQADHAIPLSFPDSVRSVLERSRNAEAVLVGNSFATAWNSFSVDQQIIIQGQVAVMKKKRFPLKPNLIDYFGALANAVNQEHADASKIAAFLKVTSQVIENETPARTRNFFKISHTFFQHHALYQDKSHRLYATDDDYAFDYITPAPTFDLNEPVPYQEEDEVPADDQLYTEDTSSDNEYNEQPQENIYTDAPLWMNPPPQPVVEGPVIRFNKVSLNFVTRYDSVFLWNTRGMLSMRDNIFVGEGGSFDWSPAGLSQDVVTCELTQYNFNVTRPEFSANLVKLN